jgi:hypothetical protein
MSPLNSFPIPGVRAGILTAGVLFETMAPPLEERVNSSRTWKSGERCRVPGTYRCEICRLAGKDTVLEMEQGAVFPMCGSCPEKDTTWRLVKAKAGRAA